MTETLQQHVRRMNRKADLAEHIEYYFAMWRYHADEKTKSFASRNIKDYCKQYHSHTGEWYRRAWNENA